MNVKPVNSVLELTSPSRVDDDLVYAVAAVGDTVLPETTITCDVEIDLFFDALGTSFSKSLSQCNPKSCSELIPNKH